MGELFDDMCFFPIDNGKIPDITLERDVLKTICYLLSETQKLFVTIEPIYQEYFSEQGWKVHRERLFPLSSDEHYLLITYDIKRSSRTPEDIERRRWIVQDINKSIKEELHEDISKKTIVPVIERRPHESGTFLAKTENHASLLILKLLQKAKGNEKNLRVGVSSTLDTNIPFKRKRKYRYDDEDELIVTADEYPKIDMNYNVLIDLLSTAEKKEDREENEEEGKIEGLKEDIPTIVLSEEAKFALDTLDNDKIFEISIEVPREKGGKHYNGFIVRPEYVNNFIKILQSLATNIP